MPTMADRPHDEVPPWMITALVAAGQAIAVALIIAIGLPGEGRHDYGAYLFAAGFGAILLLRNRFPVAVLVVAVLGVFVYYAADHPPIGMAVPVVGAFYSAAERGRVAVAAAAGVVLLAVALYFRVGDDVSSAILAYDFITNAALLGCAVALALTVRGRRALHEQHERMVALERRHHRERAARQLEAERLRLARDVHDSVGHALSIVSVQARVAQQALGGDDTPVTRALGHVLAATRSSLGELRGTLAMLHAEDDSGDAAMPGLPDIERAVRATRDAGLDVDLMIDVGSALPASVASTGFRIVQESLTNVLRHARAREARVVVWEEGGDLRLWISDDGHGLSSAGPAEGRGIVGMRERAVSVGGTLSITCTGAGLDVEATLPIEGEP